MRKCKCGCGVRTENTFVHGHNSRVAHPNSRPLIERFWEKVNKKGPLPNADAVAAHPSIEGTCCWVWTGSSNDKGYGTFKVDGSVVAAHRVSWFIAYGTYPADQCLHKCDNRACVRLLHLFEGDNTANVRDKESKGRGNQPRGEAQGIAKLTSAEVLEIRARYAKGESMHSLSLLFNTVHGNISNIIRRINWRHI